MCMLFSLMNMSETFQHCKSMPLCQQAVYSSNYIDDFLTYSSSWEVHLELISGELAALK